MKPRFSDIVVLDNYDSFTYNLVHAFREIVGHPIDVFRNDEVSVEQLSEYKSIVLSPGPGVPSEAGVMSEVVRLLSGSHRILGVCLGHQCIGEVFGASLENLSEVFHGKGMQTEVIASNDPIFKNVPKEFESGRYHSWVVSKKDFPATLDITASDENGNIMALRHKIFDVVGLQFHPESILTSEGKKILLNWVQA